MKHLSILIPTYNDVCVTLVQTLQQQASVLDLTYEILVADDGSKDQKAVVANRAINQLPHCRLLEQPQNVGRAAIRNLLAKKAKYEWLVFIDADMVVTNDDYLRSYAETPVQQQVVYGGVSVGSPQEGNLRWNYEKAAEKDHTAAQRQRTPYQQFRTTNFLVSRDVMLRYPFDERYRHYGYEDVFFGKTLYEAGIAIIHTENALSFKMFETNAQFLSKTEEGLRTLHQFRDELQGYSSLLALSDRLRAVAPLVRLWHRINKKWERRLLTSSHPNLLVFNLYRLGYFMSL